jgi:hypothetical protein
MNRIFVPCRTPEMWQRELAEPDRHWRAGYSAHALAHRWLGANDFPEPVRSALAGSGLEAFQDLELLIALPEHRVPLPPSGGHPSQTDVWVLARGRQGLLSLAVEGKVHEPFGERVEDWLRDGSPGKVARLGFLREQLGLTAVPGTIAYQLLHRAASAVIEAKRFTARHAVLVVHSFSAVETGREDYRRFLDLLGVEGEAGAVVRTTAKTAVPLSVAWVRDPIEAS